MISIVDTIIGAIRETAKQLGISIRPDNDLGKVIEYLIANGTTEGGIDVEGDGSFDHDEFIDILDQYLESSWLPILRAELLEIAAGSRSELLQTRLAQQLVPSVTNQLRSELEAPLRAQVATEETALKQFYRAQYLSEVRADLRNQLREEVKAEIRPEVIHELRQELRDEVAAVLRQELIAKLSLK